MAAAPVARTPLASSRASSSGRKRAAMTPPLLTFPLPPPFGTPEPPSPPPTASKGERNASRGARVEECRKFRRAISFPSPPPPPVFPRDPGVPGYSEEAPLSARLADNGNPVDRGFRSLRPERTRPLIRPTVSTPKPPLISPPFLMPKPPLVAPLKPSAKLSPLLPSPPHASWRDTDVRSDSSTGGERRAEQRSGFAGDVEERSKKSLRGGDDEESGAGETRGSGDLTKASGVRGPSRRRRR